MFAAGISTAERMPTISVITPAFNAEKTIQETITAVLNQTFTDFELIIIDDGSTDATLSIVRKNADARIKVFSFANAGPQKSRNRGIQRAQGDYITLIDADDLWTAEKLADQLDALKHHPTAAVAYSWTDVIDEHSQVIATGRRSQLSGNIFDALLKDNFLGSGSNPLIKAEAMKKAGGFDESILSGQDWDMWLTLAEQCQFVVVPKVQILYRKASRSQSWSSNLKRQEKGLLQVMNKHLKNDSPKKQCLANCYRYLLFECFDKCAPNPSNGWLALNFLRKAVYLEPGWWLKRSKTGAIVLLKLMRYFVTWSGFLKQKSATQYS